MSTGTTCCNELSVLYVRVAKITDSGGVGGGGCWRSTVSTGTGSCS